MSDEIHKHIIRSGQTSYCGETNIIEWAFVDFLHWYLSHKNQDRLLGCPKCLQEIKQMVDEG